MRWTSVLARSTKKVWITQIIYFLLALLFARAELYYGIRPFAAAIICAGALCGIPIAPIAAGGLIGLFTMGLNMRNALMYIFPFIIVCTVVFVLQQKNVKLNLIKSILLVIASHLFSPLLLHMTTFDFILYTVSVIASIILISVMRTAINLVLSYSTRKHIAPEDVICFAVCGTGVILGIGDFFIAGLSLQRICALFIVALAAQCGGVGAGAASGCLLGFLQAAQFQTAPYLSAVLGVCGAVGGAFRNLKRIGVSIAFLLAYVLVTLAFEGYIMPTLSILELGISLAAFLLLPKKAVSEITQLSQGGGPNLRSPKFYIRQTKSQVGARLGEIGGIFGEMARILEDGVSPAQRKVNSSELAVSAVRHICTDCVKKVHCKESMDIKRSLLSLSERLETKTAISIDDADIVLREQCIRLREMLHVMNQLKRSEREKRFMASKADSERKLVAQQMFMVSEIMERLAKDAGAEAVFDDALERTVREDLDSASISCREVLVQHSADGKTTVNIVKNACEHERQCVDKCEAIISNACGKAMISCAVNCNNAGKGLCALQYIDAPKYSVITGVATRPKSGSKVSGDNFTIQGLENDRYMIALSDGMGSGRRASEESEAAISLIEKFYLAGFRDEIVINTINKLLLLRDNDEMYATLDLCIIDRTAGKADFIKIGAIQGYIKRNNKVNTIVPQSVPLGIVDSITPAKLSIDIQSGDIIVMITDGVSESVSHSDELIADWLEQITTTNPQSIADALMKRCLKQTDGACPDDITVIVTKIQQTSGMSIKKLRGISKIS